VQAVAGKIQSLRRCGGIENREDSLNRIQEVGADPTSVAAFIEAFQASMLKAPNHQTYCKVIIVTCQFFETKTVSPDPKDDPFCLCSEEGNADFIVTLNPKDFPQERLRAKVISPEAMA
jgi:hypothetical protein